MPQLGSKQAALSQRKRCGATLVLQVSGFADVAGVLDRPK